MNLIGLSEAEIEAALEGKPRRVLLRAIKDAVTIEPSFLLEQVARELQIPRDALRRAIREKRLRAEVPMTNRWRIPRSALVEFRRRIAIGAEVAEL
jgi:excisionase family DNA binding protein